MTERLTRQTISTVLCTGEISVHGAQVLRWQPRRAPDPVLYLSSAARFEPGRSIRGGIPICWPWFGPGRAPGMEPLHGPVRTSLWHNVSHETEGDVTRVVHRLSSDDLTIAHWPHPYAVELASVFGDDLTVSLTTTNTGDQRVDFEEAVHTYLAVGDIEQVAITGLEGASYVDKTDDGRVAVQDGPLTFSGETDGVFRTCGPVALADPVLGRRLVVELEGARNAVVWNPWAAKADGIADIGPGEWRRFVCIEGANAFENAVALDPGASHTLTYRLRVEAL